MTEPTAVRTLIVDDEEPARQLLHSFLCAWPRIDVVGEAEEGNAALELIQDLEPDLVFLDVQMPNRNGFEVVTALDRQPLPLVVFVTAYDRYALRAFEVSACDYLLKPFDERRLGATIERVLSRHDSPSPTAWQGLRTLLVEMRSANHEPLVVKNNGRHIFLDPDDINWIEAAGKELRIHTTKETLVTREPISRLEARLSATRFLRVHRSAIVNRHKIRELQSWFRGDFVIVLKDGTKVVSGRHYRESVRRLVSGTVT